MDFDIRADIVLDKLGRPLDIYPFSYVPKEPRMSYDVALPLYEDFTEDLTVLLKSIDSEEEGRPKTIIIDTGTALQEIVLYRILGEIRKPKSVTGESYHLEKGDKPLQFYYGLTSNALINFFNMIKARPVNLVVVAKAGDIYETDSDGKNPQKTGELRPKLLSSSTQNSPEYLFDYIVYIAQSGSVDAGNGTFNKEPWHYMTHSGFDLTRPSKLGPHKCMNYPTLRKYALEAFNRGK